MTRHYMLGMGTACGLKAAKHRTFWTTSKSGDVSCLKCLAWLRRPTNGRPASMKEGE